MATLAVLRDPNEDVIKAGATKLTTYSAIAAALVGLDATVTQLSDVIGDDPTPDQKLALIVALLAAWTVIAAVDLIARAIVTRAKLPRFSTPPEGMKVSRPDLDGDAADGWVVASIEADPQKPEEGRLLVIKDGFKPAWVAASGVKGSGGPAADPKAQARGK